MFIIYRLFLERNPVTGETYTIVSPPVTPTAQNGSANGSMLNGTSTPMQNGHSTPLMNGKTFIPKGKVLQMNGKSPQVNGKSPQVNGKSPKINGNA